MLKFLNKPYPFNEDLKYNAKIILFISLGILVVLLFFQPIEITVFSTRQILHLVGGLVISTFLILSINLIILPSFFPGLFYSSKWNIKKEILWNLWLMLSIAGSDLLFYTKIFGVLRIDFADIGRIMLLGFLPVSALIVINQSRLFRMNLKSAQELSRKLMENKEAKERLIHFESDYKKDHLSVIPSAIILIKSADNYIEIYYKEEDGGINKHLLRSSLKRAQETVKKNNFLIRCHRAYIVNINYIKEIKGSSQGYKLTLNGLKDQVFVSPKYISDFEKCIKAT